jgi:hypothetical protein
MSDPLLFGLQPHSRFPLRLYPYPISTWISIYFLKFPPLSPTAAIISLLHFSSHKESIVTLNEFIVGGLQQSLGMVKMHLADMSDADLLTRPVPGANHANWQLGHVIASEWGMLGACGAKMPALPAGFAERYGKENAKEDNPGKFACKAELVELLEKTRSGTVAFVKAATAAQLEATSPVMPEMFPTVGALLGMSLSHDAMHMGQIQVVRRKLGKPHLF